MSAGLQLEHIGIAFGIIHKLVVGEVLQSVKVGGAVKRKEAEDVGYQLVEEAVLQQDVMRTLVGQAGQLVLPGSDHHHRDQNHRDVPCPVETQLRAPLDKQDCRGQNCRKVKPGAGQITKVGEIVGRQELPEALLETGSLPGCLWPLPSPST